MKPEHFPFKPGDSVTILTFDGPTVEGEVLGANDGGVVVYSGLPTVRFVPWSNFAGASSGDLTRERIEKIRAVPEPIYPALGDGDAWLADRQEG